MASRQNGERTRVMVVEQDWNFGVRLADWLAAHGYHPMFVRTVYGAIDGMSDFRPHAVFVGLSCSASAERIDMIDTLLLIQTLCPCAPLIILADQTSQDLAHVVFRRGVRRFLVKPAEFSQIGEVLQSELSAATVPVSASEVARGHALDDWLEAERQVMIDAK